MRHKKSHSKTPQLQLSFSKQNARNDNQNNRLNVEMLRVHAAQKQHIIQSIWQMDQQQLCTYFTSYRLFPQQLWTISDLLDANNLKLIKHDGKIYFGHIQKKKKWGLGVCLLKDGKKLYEGQFVDNQRTGYGVEIYENGNLYIGQFLNNKKHGKGQFFWFNLNAKSKQPIKNVQYYQGDWWGGLPDGEGLHQKCNGDLYKGSFKNGLKHGVGSEKFGNGDYYKGQYVNGLPQGFGEYEWSDGSFYKGDFKQGLRSGYGMWSANNQQFCQSYQGHYQMDKKSGYGVYQWENGWIYKGNFQNDYRNGFGQLFDGQNCVYRGYWINGQQTQNQPPQFSKTAQTTRSIQMGKASGKEDRYYYQTMDTKQFNQMAASRSLKKADYTIKKRPQSFSNIAKFQRSSSGTEKKKKQQNPQRITAKSTQSVQKGLYKLTNLYVPGMHSSRIRR